jgi:hypothetical protein
VHTRNTLFQYLLWGILKSVVGNSIAFTGWSLAVPLRDGGWGGRGSGEHRGINDVFHFCIQIFICWLVDATQSYMHPYLTAPSHWQVSVTICFPKKECIGKRLVWDIL